MRTTAIDFHASFAVALLAREAPSSVGDDGTQRLPLPVIVVVVDTVDVNRLPQPSGLQLDLHQQAPFVVVRLGEHRPGRSCSGVTMGRLQHRRAAALTMTPLW